MVYERHKNCQIGITISPGLRGTCQNFFSFTIGVVGGTFLEVIAQIYSKGDNCSICGPVSFFVRGVIWHWAERYNCNIMSQILSFLTHLTSLPSGVLYHRCTDPLPPTVHWQGCSITRVARAGGSSRRSSICRTRSFVFDPCCSICSPAR